MHARAYSTSETSICPYCGGHAFHYVGAPDVNRRVSNDVFHIARCASCDLMFVANPPSDLTPYYTYDYHYVPENLAALDRHLSGQQFKIDLVERFKRSGRLLEIGPSVGIFCRLAQKTGFTVSAIEMDASCVRFLRDVVGVRAVQSADPAAALAHDRSVYDVICLWHTIEHLPRPWLVLERAIQRLAPGGVLVVAAPNPLAPQARLLGKRWPHYDLPRHLFHLTIPWMTRFAEKYALDTRLITTRDLGSLYWNRFTWGMLLQNLSSKPVIKNLLFRAGLLLGYALQPFEGREGRGATYTLIFEKSVHCHDQSPERSFAQ